MYNYVKLKEQVKGDCTVSKKTFRVRIVVTQFSRLFDNQDLRQQR